MENFKINIKNSQFLGKVACFVVAASIGGVLVNATGIFDKADCDVVEEHAHLYTNEEGFNRYIISEYMNVDGYLHQDEYIKLDEDEFDFYSFISKKDLISIKDNIHVILAIQNNNQDYLEYEYTYKKRVTRNNGKTSYRTWRRKTDWTANPDNVENEIYGTWKDLSFTGDTRLVHYVYQTYKIELNEKGKYVLVEGPVVDDVRECLDEYPYIKRNFYRTVYLDPNTINMQENNQEKKLVNP